jgi:hypothetical protein
LKGENIMGKKISGAIVASLFSLSIMAGNAFADTYSNGVNISLSADQNVNGPNDSRFRTLDNTRDIYMMNGTLPGGTEINSQLNTTTGTGTVQPDLNNNSNVEIDIYDHMDHPDVAPSTSNMTTPSQDFDTNGNPAMNITPDTTLNSDVHSTIGTGSAYSYPLKTLSGRECINVLSKESGSTVKNDAFFACQRYKWN